MYCFARWKRSTRGSAPDMPRGSSYLVLADSGPGSRWCVLRCEADTLPRRTKPLSTGLIALIESGHAFPPALALASTELRRRGSPAWEPPQITNFLARALRHHLRRQPCSGYVLAEARRGEAGYLSAGEFIWVLHVRREGRARRRLVTWVSSDFNVYENPARDFNLPRSVSTVPSPRGAR